MQGKPLSPKNSLHPVQHVYVQDAVSSDLDSNAQAINDVFSRKWETNNLHRTELIHDFIHSKQHNINITPCELERALCSHRKPQQLDSEGVCGNALWNLYNACSVQVLRWFNFIATSFAELSSTTVHGIVLAKQGGAIPPEKTRAILPMPVILSMLDMILASRLEKVLDPLVQSLPASFVIGARRKTQMLDVTFPLSLVIEKGLDMHSKAVVASGDIKQYFDYVNVLSIAHWLVKHFYKLQDIAALVSIQCLPSITLSIAGREFVHRFRGSGLVTGTRVAVQLARIPVFDVVEFLLHRTRSSMPSFKTGGVEFVGGRTLIFFIQLLTMLILRVEALT